MDLNIALASAAAAALADDRPQSAAAAAPADPQPSSDREWAKPAHTQVPGGVLAPPVACKTWLASLCAG